MISRNVDDSGDVLPVTSPEDLARGTEAVAIGLADHLRMFTGEWWEYPEKGNGIFDLIAGERVTEKQVPALCSYLSSYVGSFPEVEEVTDVQGRVMNGVFSYTATARMLSGERVRVSF
ncbi:MAG: hypothetical protein IJI08_09835 [Clostridia bacterium]|nr:hypothetical protein [Clostridia bacterium]